MIVSIPSYLELFFSYVRNHSDSYKQNTISKENLKLLNEGDDKNIYVYVDDIVYKIPENFDEKNNNHPPVMMAIQERIKCGDYDFKNDFEFHTPDQRLMWEKYRFAVLQGSSDSCCIC